MFFIFDMVFYVTVLFLKKIVNYALKALRKLSFKRKFIEDVGRFLYSNTTDY